MSDNYLRRVRRKAKQDGLAIRRNLGEEGGWRLVRLSDDFDVFGRPVDLEEIEAWLRKEGTP